MLVVSDVADEVRAALGEQSVQPVEIVVAGSLNAAAQRAVGEWFWLFPQPVRPAPDALEQLLRAALDSDRIGLIGPLMVQSQRRARVDLIESCGLTLTPIGRLMPAVEGGEPDQGQLSTMDVLGVDASAALVRRDVWLQADGLAEGLPPPHWPAWSLAGGSLGRPPGGRRAGGPGGSHGGGAARSGGAAVLGTSAGLVRLAWWTRLRLLIGSLFGALGFLLGKDAARAGAELKAIGRWLAHRSADPALHGRSVDAKALAGLTPSRRQLFGHSIDRAAGAVAESWAELAGRDDETSLDELTADDFAARGRLRRLSPLAVGASLVSILTVFAGWRLIGDGRLAGVGLLPSQVSWVACCTTGSTRSRASPR